MIIYINIMDDYDNFDFDLDLDNAKEEFEEVKTSLKQLEKKAKKSSKKSLVKASKKGRPSTKMRYGPTTKTEKNEKKLFEEMGISEQNDNYPFAAMPELHNNQKPPTPSRLSSSEDYDLIDDDAFDPDARDILFEHYKSNPQDDLDDSSKAKTFKEKKPRTDITGYMLFVQEEKGKPGNLSDRSEKWKQLSEEDKKKYRQRADDKNEIARKERMKYGGKKSRKNKKFRNKNKRTTRR